MGSFPPELSPRSASAPLRVHGLAQPYVRGLNDALRLAWAAEEGAGCIQLPPGARQVWWHSLAVVPHASQALRKGTASHCRDQANGSPQHPLCLPAQNLTAAGSALAARVQAASQLAHQLRRLLGVPHMRQRSPMPHGDGASSIAPAGHDGPRRRAGGQPS